MSGGFWSYKFGGTKVAKFDNQSKHGCKKITLLTKHWSLAIRKI